ncbi:MAG: polysaccharide deacetylase family protein [Oscillibacter sp.]|nr:polysaccharide deacetylase family protein [Oscillibacter sp.]
MGKRRSLAGAGLFALFAAALLFGIFFGDKVIWRLGLEPRILEPLPIFMYHDVKADGEEILGMAVSVSKLREDFTTLRDLDCTPILPRDLVSGEPLPDRPVMITFDDGYISNYLYLYPLLLEFGFKAVIHPIVASAELTTDGFCNWEMYREMEASGLVEVGSHAYDLHNPWSGGKFLAGQPNGVQRRPGETEGEFQVRVLDDIQKSYDRLTEELGHPPVCFAYPFGADEPDTWDLVDRLFPVSLLTWEDHAELAKGTARMPRWTIEVDTPVSFYVKPDGPWHEKQTETK